MSYPRPCDCASRHREFASAPLGMVVVHSTHQHDSLMCAPERLGIGGCPGDGNCRDWVIGAFSAGITMAEVMGDPERAAMLCVERDCIERMEWPA